MVRTFLSQTNLEGTSESHIEPVDIEGKDISILETRETKESFENFDGKIINLNIEIIFIEILETKEISESSKEPFTPHLYKGPPFGWKCRR